MSELSKEQYEQLPDFIRDDYTEVDGTYKHAGMLKVKQTANELDTRAKELESKYGEVSGRLTEFEKGEAEKLEAARKEAYEKARKEGNTEELEKQWQEKLQDAERRAGESEKKYQERMSGLAVKQQKAIAAELSEYATPAGKSAFKRLIESQIKVDPETGEETYLNEDGSASSLNREQFIAELKTSETFKPLLAADIATQGGGDVNGNGQGSAKTTPGNTKARLQARLKQHGL